MVLNQYVSFIGLPRRYVVATKDDPRQSFRGGHRHPVFQRAASTELPTERLRSAAR